MKPRLLRMCVYFSRPELQLGRNVGPTLIEFAKIRDVLGNNFDGDMQRNDRSQAARNSGVCEPCRAERSTLHAQI